MNIVAKSLGVLLGGALIVSQAHAVILNPGSFVAPPAAPPVSGTFLTSVTAPISSPALSGTLVSSVYGNDPLNVWGGYTFTYEFAMGLASPDSANAISISSFAGFLTDVAVASPVAFLGPGVVPAFASRSLDADVVRFQWLGAEVLPGQNSMLLVVRTSALQYQPTTVGVIDGVPAPVLSLAPIAVPEPGSLALLGLGLGLFLVRRKA